MPFSLNPSMLDLSPLDTLIQHELNDCIGSHVETGCLVLCPAPTGIGKTHTLCRAILDELLRNRHAGQSQRMLYYVTNSVDNVSATYQALLDMIDQLTPECLGAGVSLQSLKNSVVYLPSQSAQLLSVPEALVDAVIDRFQLQSQKLLMKDWRQLKSQRRMLREHPALAAGLRDAVETLAQQTYRQLLAQIRARQQGPEALVLTAADYAQLDQLVPGDRVRRGEAQVCFMTTRKLMAGFKTLKGTTHPIRDLHGALLLVDEFDRQNEVILHVLTERKAIDLIGFVRTLHANLNIYRLEDSERYREAQGRFDELTEEINRFAQYWHLQFAMNLDGASLEQDRVRLFSDRTITHAHSAEHKLTLVTAAALAKNLIHSEPHNLSGDELQDEPKRLSRFVNEADWLFKKFIQVMRGAIWSFARAGHVQDAVPTQLEAVASILQHLNLQEQADIVFDALDAQVSFAPGRNKALFGRSANRPYHDHGLKLTEVRRHDNSRDTVCCYYTGLALTPSGLLARLVEAGAKILGVSATATNGSVIRNFDLEYLQLRLGSQYVALTALQQQRIGQYYRSRRRYAETGVELVSEFVMADLAVVRQLLEAYTGQPVRHPETVIGGWMGKGDEDIGSKQFLLTWVSRLLQALQRFAVQSHNRYMLVLLNRGISPVDHAQFIHFLKWVMTGKHSPDHLHMFSVDSEFMRAGGYDGIRNTLATSTDKVVVLSTYASMGEGKNPDYPVRLAADRQGLVWVGAGAEPVSANTDIDTLYLEKPSHQLLTSEDYQADQLLQFHQVLSLQERGYISVQYARQWVRQCLRGAPHIHNLREYHQTGDYCYAIQRTLEQAIGRSARTAFKRRKIFLLADDGVMGALADDHRQPDVLSLEYAALRDRAAAAVHAGSTPTDRQQLMLKNRAALATTDTLALIRELMAGFCGLAPLDAIGHWEALRHQLLSEPALLQPSPVYPRLYIRSPANEGYQFSGNLENQQEHLQSERDLHFFDDPEATRWITEIDSGLPVLMKNPQVRQHFEQQGFAMDWADGQWLMNPAAFFNLYKGALGEEGIRALLQHVGFVIEPLPTPVYEVFDFIVSLPSGGRRIAVDAKHWSIAGDIENHADKIRKLREATGIEHVAYVNLLGSQDSVCRRLDHDFTVVEPGRATVLEVPGLIERGSGHTLTDHLVSLMQWMGEQP